MEPTRDSTEKTSRLSSFRKIEMFGSPYRDDEGKPVQIGPTLPDLLFQDETEAYIHQVHTVYFYHPNEHLNDSRAVREALSSLDGAIVRPASGGQAVLHVFCQVDVTTETDTVYHALFPYVQQAHTEEDWLELQREYPNEELVLGPAYAQATITTEHDGKYTDYATPRRLPGQFVVYKRCETYTEKTSRDKEKRLRGKPVNDYVVVAVR